MAKTTNSRGHSELDTMIKDATIVDGVSKKEYLGSIGIIGDRIVALGEVKVDAATSLIRPYRNPP